MLRIFSYLIIFAIGFLIGGIVPSYTVQYKQRIYARLDQVTTDLKPFQDIAVQYHGGNMRALIDHHLASNDPTFHDEGLALEMMIGSRDELAAARQALESSALDQAIFIFSGVDRDLAKTTWTEFRPAFVTTRESLTFATFVGFLLCGAFFIGTAGLKRLIR